MGYVIKTPEGKYVQKVKASIFDDWKCTSWNIEDAKIFKDEASVNKYFAFMIGYFKKWQAGSFRESVEKLLSCEVIPIRVTVSEYGHTVKASSLRAFEKVILERLEEL